VCVAHLWTRPRRPETATLFAEGFADVDFRVRSRLRDFSRCAASSARPFRAGCCRTCLNSSARANFSTTCKLHAERDGISRSKREGIRRRLTSACEVGCFSLRACWVETSTSETEVGCTTFYLQGLCEFLRGELGTSAPNRSQTCLNCNAGAHFYSNCMKPHQTLAGVVRAG